MLIYNSTQVSKELSTRLKEMPKAEIHVHLEGAIDAETIYEIARRNQIELPAKSLAEWKNFYEFRDFNHFAEVYTTSCNCIKTPDDYTSIVERFLKKQSEQNIQYSEAFVSVSFHRNCLKGTATIIFNLVVGELRHPARLLLAARTVLLLNVFFDSF